MSIDDLSERLQRAGSPRIPDPAPLLLRAFPEPVAQTERQTPHSRVATAALVAASVTPLWLRPAAIDSERTRTFIDATTQLTELYARDWKDARHEDC